MKVYFYANITKYSVTFGFYRKEMWFSLYLPSGKGYFSTPNLKIQWLRYVSPGFKITDGQCALFGLSG